MYIPINIQNMYITIDFENLRLRVYNIGGGKIKKNIVMHAHGKYYYELHLICDGKGKLNADNVSFDLRKGHLFMTGPQISHEQLIDMDNPMTEYCIGFNIEKKKNRPDTEMSRLFRETYFWFGEDDGTIQYYFEKLATELSKKQCGYMQVVEKILTLLIIELVRKYRGNTAVGEEIYSSSDNLRMRLIEMRFLTNYATVSAESLSNELHLSRRQLLRFLKKQYGKTFREMKHDAILRAALKLKADNKSVSEIAKELGYTDAENFKKNYHLK